MTTRLKHVMNAYKTKAAVMCASWGIVASVSAGNDLGEVREKIEKAHAIKAAGGDIVVVKRALYAHHPHGVEVNENMIKGFFLDEGRASCTRTIPCPVRAARRPSPSCTVSKVPYKLGVARYTLHKQNLDRSLEMLQDMDVHYMGLLENSIQYDADDAEIAAYKTKCAKHGVEVVSLGPLYYSTEEELSAACKFAKRFGMKYISVVPFEWNPKIAGIADNEERKKLCPGREWRLESDRMMNLLEKYCIEYDLKAAVHNHGPDNAFLYPTAEASLARIGNRDKRLGVCLDVGHERRAGLDPADFIRRHGDRIVEIHLKNIKIDPVKNYAKEGPRGELDIPAILHALTEVNFSGYCLVEYEKDFDCLEVPLAESIGYYRGVMDCMHPKAE